MRKKIGGIVPVMLTPFKEDGRIDLDGLHALVEWYIAHGANTLFAVCQSSEMQFLSLDERTELARRTVEFVAGRLPVIASGHISDLVEDQREELAAMAETGVDGLVLVTNYLDPSNDGMDKFRHSLNAVLSWLPSGLPLGLYECPVPYRRLLSDDEFALCRDIGRFVVLKDVSCDIDIVRRRVALAEGSNLNVVNANAAIAAEAMRSGSDGFSGVFTNFHPDLYAWLYQNKDRDDTLHRDLEAFLALAAMAEPMGYPMLAKIYHQRIGTFRSTHSRAVSFDITERFWGVLPLLDHIQTQTERFRRAIADL